MSSLGKIILILGLLFGVAVAGALAESRTITVTIDNPDGPLIEAKVTFFLPFGLAPINLTNDMLWNEATRELVINLGSFTEKESKRVAFTIDGPAGQYLINGKVVGRWPATDTRPEENFEEAIDNFAVALGGQPRSALGDFLRNLRSIPELVGAAEQVTRPVSVILGGIGIGAVVNSAISASAEFAAGLSKFFSYLGLGFLRLRRRKPWGRVYNHLTGKPIESVMVRVLDDKFKKVKETQMTDAEGRFGFLVSPGEYYLKISKRGFEERETQMIKVLGPIQTLNLEIALEPLKSELKPKTFRALKVLHFFLDLLDRLSPWILVIGAILAIFTALLAPSILSYIVLGLYVFLIVLKIILHETFFKSFGWVLDHADEKPLALAVVRIFNTDKNWLLGTRVTDKDGRFNFLIGPGNYYVTAVKEGYKPFQSASTHFTKAGLISYDIKLEKQ